MAGLDRESIYAALAARLATLVPTTLVSVSRKLPPAQVPGALEQPCAYVPAAKEVPEFTPRMPYKWTLHTEIILYALTGDPNVAPSSLLTPIVKAIEAALQWAAGDGFMSAAGSPTTLGQRCEWVRIGSVEYGEGILDGQGIALIPLEILAVEGV